MKNLKIEQNVKVKINGQVVECRIIGIDADASRDLWVVEIANPDNGHFVSSSSVVA